MNDTELRIQCLDMAIRSNKGSILNDAQLYYDFATASKKPAATKVSKRGVKRA
jgi:hypothetical protein